MKIRNFSLLAVAAILTSCGTSTYYSSTSFNDAVYSVDEPVVKQNIPVKKEESQELTSLKNKTIVLAKASNERSRSVSGDTLYLSVTDTIFADGSMSFEELLTKFDNPVYIINFDPRYNWYYDDFYMWNPWRSYYYGMHGYYNTWNPYWSWYSPYGFYNDWYWYGGYYSWYPYRWASYPWNYGLYSWYWGGYPWYWDSYPYYPGGGYTYTRDNIFYGKRTGNYSQNVGGTQRSGGSYVRRGGENSYINQTSGMTPDRSRYSSGSSVYRREGSSQQQAGTYRSNSVGTRSRSYTQGSSSSTGNDSYRRSTYIGNSSQSSSERNNGSTYRNNSTQSSSQSNSRSYNTYSTPSRSGGGSSSGSSGSSSSSNSSGGGSVYRR